MNQSKYVFTQLIEFLSHNDFIRCVSKHQSNYKVKTFTCWLPTYFFPKNRDKLSGAENANFSKLYVVMLLKEIWANAFSPIGQCY